LKNGAESLVCGMKLPSLVLLLLFLGCSPNFANPLPKEPGTKITKNEAEHIALKNHEGARVTAAKLETSEGHKIWRIELAQNERRTIVAVDAVTGQIVPEKGAR
jgi:Peptidase propeptide and YPEB domain